MTTKTLDRKIGGLKTEIELLRSFVIGQAGKDPEGRYNPAFVKKLLRVTSGKSHRMFEFVDAKSFLGHLWKDV